MASIDYLFSNRAKFPIGSINYFRAWAKRIITFPELGKRNIRRKMLLRKGAKIHVTSEVGVILIQGTCKLLTIGSESFLGRVKLNIHDEIIIGNRVCINDGVELLTASHDVTNPAWNEIKAKIIIEDYVWIGTGAMILPGVTIGRGAVVGASAVISKSVGAGEIVVGNPAKAINKKRCIELNYNPCEFLAANRAWLIG